MVLLCLLRLITPCHGLGPPGLRFPWSGFFRFLAFGGNIGPVATSVVGPQTFNSSLSAPAPHVAVSSSCDVSLPAPVPTSSVRPQVNQVSDWPLSGWV